MRIALFNLELCTLAVVGMMRGILVAVVISEGIAGAMLVRGILVAVTASKGIAGATSGGLLVLLFLVSYCNGAGSGSTGSYWVWSSRVTVRDQALLSL